MQELAFVGKGNGKIAVVALGFRLRSLQLEMLAEAPLVTMADLRPAFENQLDVVEYAHAHRGRELVELGVDADAFDLVGVDDAEVAEQTDAIGQRVVVGDDGATLDGVKQLGRMEAQRADIAPVVDRPPLVTNAERMGAVVDDPQIVLARDLLDAFDIARIAEYMRRDDGGGVGLDISLDLFRVQIPGRRRSA